VSTVRFCVWPPFFTKVSSKDGGLSVAPNNSNRTLTYDRLKVTDANNEIIPAYIQLLASDKIVIKVDDKFAQYPLTIDPTVGDEQWANMGGALSTNGTVYAIAQNGTDIYVGGSFTDKGNHFAKWNGTTWTSISVNSGNVYALVVDGTGNLYVGGSFTSVDGVSVNNIAKWNGTTWSALGTGLNGKVSALVVDSNGNLYAGGAFTSGGGVPNIAYIAKWNGTAWSALGSGMNNVVNALAVDSSNNVYAGGNFTTAGGLSTNYIAKWNGSVWSAFSGSGANGIGMDGVVNALAVDSSGNLYAGGQFTTPNYIAKWNGSSWSALGSGINNYVFALSAGSSGVVYAAGNFTTADGASANRIAKWSGTTWSALGSGINGQVNALSVSSNDLYAGGTFTTAGGAISSNIARWLLSPDVVAPTVPITNTFLATPVSGSKVNLSWGASTDNIGVTNYKIYRNGVLLITLGNVTNYSDTGLAQLTLYSYTVSACDQAGNCSAQSVSRSATTLDGAPPTVPSGLSATAVSDSQINLSWSAATDNVGVTNYKIYRNASLHTTVGNVTSYSSVQYQSALTSFSYTVSACDAAGNCSAQSAAVSATTLADTTAPVVPTLSATPQNASIILNWTGAFDAGGVVLCKVYRDGVLLPNKPCSGFSDGYSDTGLMELTSYSYTVAVCDVAGNCSAESVAVLATTLDGTSPSVPSGLSATPVSASQIDLSWNAAADNVGVTNYKIYRNGILLTTLGNVTSYNNIGLMDLTSYSYNVAACDGMGNCSAQSSPASTTTLADTTAPTIPSGLSATTVSVSQINLSWSAAADDIGVTAYKIYRDGILIITLGNVTNYSNSGLVDFTGYSYTVAACDQAGNCSAESVSASATTLDGTAPSTPLGLSATPVSASQIDLIWNAATDNVGVTSYKIYRNGGLRATLGNVTSYSNTGLLPLVGYSYTVAACDDAGHCSAQSLSVPATTLADTTAPSVPSGLSATTISAWQINLSWNAATDDIGVTAYKVYRDGMLFTTLGNVTSYSNTGLQPSVEYGYTLAACDASSNCSTQSVLALATTNEKPADIVGAVGNDKAGTSVAFVGDFNGDGYGDYVVGIPGYDIPAAPPIKIIKNAGRAEVISGKDGTVLAFINGVAAKDSMGFAVAGNGDINKDGFNDVLVGAPKADDSAEWTRLHAGSVTLLYGHSDGNSGYSNRTFYGSTKKSLYGSAVALGDLNNNGYAEIIIGAPKDDDVTNKLIDAGSVKVIDSNGAQIQKYYGAASKDYFGSSIAIGKINNDANGDVIVGSPNADDKANKHIDAGEVAVFSSTTAAEVHRQYGAAAKIYFGKSVASFDINNDGRDDVLAGSPGESNPNGALKNAGSVRVLSGMGFAQLTKKYGAVAKANLGNSVAAGDVNGDGYADIIAGASNDDKPAAKIIKDAGSVTIWSGNGYAQIGSTLYGGASKDYFGAAVSAGDINSDGKADLIIGIPGFDVPATPTIKIIKDAGAVHVASGASL
jgi:chitodextrinase